MRDMQRAKTSNLIKNFISGQPAASAQLLIADCRQLTILFSCEICDYKLFYRSEARFCALLFRYTDS